LGPAATPGTKRLLIAGVGNIFLGDDAFGVEVVRRLTGRPLPEGARVVDFGIRGIDLTYALLDGYEAVILVDATARGGTPGTLYVIEPDAGALPEPGPGDLMLEPHSLDPAKVLRLAAALGGRVRRVVLVGCEPAAPGGENEMRMEMSEPVRVAVDEAVSLVESLAAKFLSEEPRPRIVEEV
jgi:hydrogenase maturation protease